MTNPIVLFDGQCNLCSGAVQFIIERDKAAKLRFASLQSDLGQNYLAKHQLEEQLEREQGSEKEFDTFVLIEEGQAYTRSTAALRIARYFHSPMWRMLYGLIIIPRPLRDVVYRFISRNRYRWFGKTNSCWMPTPELKQRFL